MLKAARKKIDLTLDAELKNRRCHKFDEHWAGIGSALLIYPYLRIIVLSIYNFRSTAETTGL